MKSNTPITLAIICLWCWATLLPLRALPLHVFLAGGSGSEATGAPINTAVFAGSQYLRVSDSTPTGLGNSKSFTIAFWIRMNGGDGTSQRILDISYGTIARFFIARGTGNKIRSYGYNVGQSEIFQLTGASDVVVASGWTHVMLAVDLSSTSNRALYINGVNEGATSTWHTYTNDFINFLDTAGTRITIGADKENTPSSFLNASIGELWFNDTYNNVIGDYYSGGNAVFLGANGSTPTGSQPVIYYSDNGTGNSWNFNNGTGPVLSKTGTLTVDATPPTFVP